MYVELNPRCLISTFATLVILLSVYKHYFERSIISLSKGIVEGLDSKRGIIEAAAYKLTEVGLIATFLWTYGYFDVMFQPLKNSDYVVLLLQSVGLGLAIIVFNILILASITTIGFDKLKRGLVEIIIPGFPIATMLAISSITEELIFRGFLLLQLYECLKTWSAALLIQALIFSLAHKRVIGEFVEGLSYMIGLDGSNGVSTSISKLILYFILHAVYLVYGFLLGSMFIDERNLIGPIVSHITYNLGFNQYYVEVLKRKFS